MYFLGLMNPSGFGSLVSRLFKRARAMSFLASLLTLWAILGPPFFERLTHGVDPRGPPPVPGRCHPANHSGLLPASAERLVELDHRERFVQPNLSQHQFCLKQIAVSIKGVELGVDATAISDIG